MDAILIKQFGSADELYIGQAPVPTLHPYEVLVQVRAAGINRADILQRQGHYPPPKDSSTILGLEIAGKVVEVGSQVTKWKVGDRVFGLLSGGGYAQYAALHEDMAMAIPEAMHYHQAAAIPEAFLTAYQSLFWLGKLRSHEKVLIHAGASGVGTAAIQLAYSNGAAVLVTASQSKHALCLKLGAQQAIDYKTEDIVQKVKEYTDHIGVNVVLDPVGGNYFKSNLSVLQNDGRLVMISVMGGYKVPEVDLRPIIFKRLEITGSTLRSRSKEYQIALTQDFLATFGERLFANKIHAVVDTVFDWYDVTKAHRYMESNLSAGKLILSIPHA